MNLNTRSIDFYPKRIGIHTRRIVPIPFRKGDHRELPTTKNGKFKVCEKDDYSGFFAIPLSSSYFLTLILHLAMPQKSKQIVALILMTVFAFYYANICFFYHSHIVNGTTIVHSHMYSKTSAGTHTISELTLISALSVFHSLQANVCSAGSSVFFILQICILPFQGEKFISTPVACISLRAPPLPVSTIR
jgi:hypothetical protein